MKSERVFSLPDYGYGSLSGCSGINCRHYLIPFVVGVNYKPELSGFLENSTVIWKLPKKTFEEKTKKLYNKGVKENGAIHGARNELP
ncbi:phage minor capsid protein [Gemella sp.]